MLMREHFGFYNSPSWYNQNYDGGAEPREYAGLESSFPHSTSYIMSSSLPITEQHLHEEPSSLEESLPQ